MVSLVKNLEGLEKRRHPRINVVLKVDYSTQREFLADYSCNISSGGLFIVTNRAYDIGDKLNLEISFPGLLDSIRCSSVVRWRRSQSNQTADQPAGIGVEFEFATDVERLAIQRLVQQMSEAPPIKDYCADLPDKYNLLVAEDNRFIRKMFHFAVQKFCQSRQAHQRGINLIEAADGAEAWAYLNEQKFDLAVIDYYMPIMNGGQLIEKIRSNSSQNGLPIIVASTGGEKVRQAVYSLGADLFIDKQVLVNEFFETLNRFL
jgi:type IV pilus assembly protein PilZ